MGELGEWESGSWESGLEDLEEPFFCFGSLVWLMPVRAGCYMLPHAAYGSLPTPRRWRSHPFFFLVPCNGLCQCGRAAICCRVQHMAACPHRSCTTAIYLRHANAHALAGLASRRNLPVWGVNGCWRQQSHPMASDGPVSRLPDVGTWKQPYGFHVAPHQGFYSF